MEVKVVRPFSVLKRFHPVAGVVGMLMIICFLLSSIVVEVFGDEQMIRWVKSMIVYGLFILVPAIAITGISGVKRSSCYPHHQILSKKLMRMKVIGGNGICVLIPCALVLDYFASHGEFGLLFVVVQGIEYIAGLTNLGLMGLNMRDGLLLGRQH